MGKTSATLLLDSLLVISKEPNGEIFSSNIHPKGGTWRDMHKQVLGPSTMEISGLRYAISQSIKEALKPLCILEAHKRGSGRRTNEGRSNNLPSLVRATHA